jgi:hypothetical protein
MLPYRFGLAEPLYQCDDSAVTFGDQRSNIYGASLSWTSLTLTRGSAPCCGAAGALARGSCIHYIHCFLGSHAVDTEEVQASEELLDRAATSGANAPEAFNAKAFRRSLNKTGRYTRQPTNDKESLALMDDHGVGYSLRGLVAQMKDNGGVWQQVNTAVKRGVASAAMCTSRCRLRGLPYVRPAVQKHSIVCSRHLVQRCTAGQGASA